METKSNANWMERLYKILGYQEHICIEANGLAGGFIIMWKRGLNMRCRWQTGKVICCDLLNEQGGVLWSMVACYSTPYMGEKKNSGET